jgi:hypothetical protein
VVADYLVDDEADELLAEVGVELGVFGQRSKPRDLPTALVMRKRSASMWISAASILSMLAR